MHAIFTAILDLFFLKDELYGEEDEGSWNLQHIMAVALIVYTALIACCVGCLASYHGKLACEGATTNEELRGKLERGNPYDRGCGYNCYAFWFGGTSRIYAD